MNRKPKKQYLVPGNRLEGKKRKDTVSIALSDEEIQWLSQFENRSKAVSAMIRYIKEHNFEQEIHELIP